MNSPVFIVWSEDDERYLAHVVDSGHLLEFDQHIGTQRGRAPGICGTKGFTVLELALPVPA